MGIRGHGRPRPKKQDPIAAVLPEVVQTAPKRPRTEANREAEERYRLKKDAERKAKSRAVTLEQFWEAAVRYGNADKIAAWKIRQERVLDLTWFIEQHLKGTYDASPERDATLPEDKQEFVGVEEGDQGLREDLAQYGECSRAILQLGRFWKSAERMSKYTDDGADSVLGRYGILIAVPTDLVREWDEYLKKVRSQQPVPQPEEVTLTCACGTNTLVHSSTAKQILSTTTGYRCPTCSDKVTDVIDDWGRLKL